MTLNLNTKKNNLNNNTKKKKNKNSKTKQSKTKKSIFLESIPLNININLNNYKTIFTNKKIIKDIVFLNKHTFDIFYNCKYKYPLLVREEVNINTCKGNIKRKDQEEPWANDTNILDKYQYTKDDYDTYEYYEGSQGHNAPAGWHKNNFNEYKETFLTTNITPQNINLNTGYWNILEMCCKNLSNNKDLYNINIFTGSIPNTHNSLFYNAMLEKSEMNIPIYMFKIICFNHIKYPNITFIEIILLNNKTYLIDINKPYIHFYKFLLPLKSYHWFENKSGINIVNLLKYYNININNLKSFKNIINISMKITPHIRVYMYFSITLVHMFECKTLKELYNNVKLNLIDIIIMKQIFYKLRNKLIRDTLLYTKFTTLKKFDIFFQNFKNELETIYTIDDKDYETELLKIDQDTYLNNYYNIVKTKLVKLIK